MLPMEKKLQACRYGRRRRQHKQHVLKIHGVEQGQQNCVPPGALDLATSAGVHFLCTHSHCHVGLPEPGCLPSFSTCDHSECRGAGVHLFCNHSHCQLVECDGYHILALPWPSACRLEMLVYNSLHSQSLQ